MHDCDCDEPKSGSKGFRAVCIAARIAAMALSVASAALMATASQCTLVYEYGAPAHNISYSDYGPFVYLVAANATAACLEAIAVFLSVWKKGADSLAKVLLPIIDAAVPALLYSSAGAAFAAGDLTYCGPNGRRISICDGGAGAGGSSFCGQVHLSTYIALAAAIAASVAELAKSVPLSLGGSSDSDSDSGCGGHGGFHHRH